MNDRQVEALADCPFCGAHAHTLLRGFRYADGFEDNKEPAVACPTCEARAPTKTWNARSRTPSAPDVAISHDDLCALSRCWNDLHVSPHGIGYRVNQWLKSQIAAALSASEAKAGEPVSKIALDIADEFIGVCEAAARQAKRTGNTFVLDRDRVANLIQAKLARLAPTPPQVDREAVARLPMPLAKTALDDLEFLMKEMTVLRPGSYRATKTIRDLREALAPAAPAQEGE